MPVLTIPPPVRERGSPLYKTILCPLDFSAAAVVMGAQGKSVVDRSVFGSTTHRVIREPGCPVLTLPSGSIGAQ